MSKELYSDEAELGVLRCCFFEGTDTLGACTAYGLAPEHFNDPRTGVAYRALLNLAARNIPANASALFIELQRTDQLEAAGGMTFLIEVTDYSQEGTSISADLYMRTIRSMAQRRAILRAAQMICEQVHTSESDDLEEFAVSVEKLLFDATHIPVANALRPAREAVIEAQAGFTKMLDRKGEITGVTSGFAELDQITWGFQPGEVVVLAARPSMGKTALALNIIESAVCPKKGEPVRAAYFSLEMSSAQLMQRMIASRAGLIVQQLREGVLSRSAVEQQLKIAGDALANSPLYIDDSVETSPLLLRAKIRREHRKEKFGLVIIDYLQLLSPNTREASREQQVAEASRCLKALALELKIPVIVLSQVNRASEKEGRAPKLADLRESGSIEQDADTVLILARPNDADDNQEVAGDSADLIVAKQRNGPVGSVRLNFRRKLARFESPPRQPYAED